MEELVRTQFNVEMHCDGCKRSIEQVLSNMNGVKKFEIDLTNQEVVVESTAMFTELLEALENTGKKVSVSGQGKGLGAAVCILDEALNISGPSPTIMKGVIRFIQISEEIVIIEGTVSGLSPGLHGVHITETGDFSEGLKSSGGHWNPKSKSHGGPGNPERHAGDLGNILINEDGTGKLRLKDDVIKIWDIIGRGLIIDERADDLGNGSMPNSKMDGNSGKGVLGGIIARSAGVGENRKKVCPCTSPNF